MGFWIFMMLISLLIPCTMVGFGKHFIKKAPKEINMYFGYRTSRSMKNKDTWEFAHHYLGNLWTKIGSIMLVPSFIAMLFVINKDISYVGIFGGLLCGVQLIFLIGSIFPVEKALKRKFDEYGNRKKE